MQPALVILLILNLKENILQDTIENEAVVEATPSSLIFSEHSPAKPMRALKIPLNVFLGPALWQRVIFVLSES